MDWSHKDPDLSRNRVVAILYSGLNHRHSYTVLGRQSYWAQLFAQPLTQEKCLEKLELNQFLRLKRSILMAIKDVYT